MMQNRRHLETWILGGILAGGALLVWLALVEAPSLAGRTGFTAPLTWKLFFFHVPVALVTFAAFAIGFYHSLFYLLRPHPERDHAAQAAIETGAVFGALTLATGMLWGKAEWGVAWRWSDPKLVLVLLMFLVYVAYLFLRREIDDEDRRARVSAVYALAGFATVPLAWFAQRIWQTNHPEVFGSGRAESGVVTPGILPVFLLGLLVFLLVFAYLYRWRQSILRLAARLQELETRTEGNP